MVFCLSLYPILKDILPGNVIKTKPETIMNQLLFDPDVTQMDVVMLSVPDLASFNKKELRHKLKVKHPDICVIFIREHTDDAIELKYSSYTRTVRKITHDALEDIFTECVNEFKLATDKHMISSNDFKEIN